jgi:hypothetical protein
LLVERTSFISCRTTDNGGGIFFYSSSNGQCVLSRICGFNCSSTLSDNSYGQFAEINTKNDFTYKNHVNDSTFTHSSKTGTQPRFALELNNGNILCPSVNLTNNECYGFPALGIYQLSSTSSDTCCISYSSIVNNTANGGWGCIFLSNSSSSMRIDTCNILYNNQTSLNYGIILTNGNLLIKDSCILGNNEGKKVFNAYPPGKITLSKCTIDDDVFSKRRYSGSVTINKTIEKAFIHVLSHFATQSCDSYFDLLWVIMMKPCVLCGSSGCLKTFIIKHPIIYPFKNIVSIFLLTIL